MSEVPLKEHIETQLEAIRGEIRKSERLLEARLESMNEVRAQLKDQAATMATRDQLDIRIEVIIGRLNSLENSRAYTIGVAVGLSAVVSLVGAIAGLMIGT